MNTLKSEVEEILRDLARDEANFIISGLEQSDDLGRKNFRDTINHFTRTYIEPKYHSKTVPSTTPEYKYLLVEILKRIDDEYLHILIEEDAISKFEDMEIEDITKALKA